MTKRVLVIGGYGNFGRFISRRLAMSGLRVVVAGRSPTRARQLAREISAEPAAIDFRADLPARLAEIRPDIVVHTSGPFQSQDYRVAEACIARGCHYIDLADARAFVENIVVLDSAARANDVLVVSGASSVPCLSAALLDHYQTAFRVLEEVDFGIATAQRAGRGLATTAAILGQAGKAFTTLVAGRVATVHGWQGLRARTYREAGRRLLANCDVPDLALFPTRYPGLKTIRFSAGLEVPLLHMGLWLLSWLVRGRLIRRLEAWAPILLACSNLFDRLGSATSALHMDISGFDRDGAAKSIAFELTARAGDGLYIPCVPAILMARKLARGELSAAGALPCLGFITKDEYLAELKGLDITCSEKAGGGSAAAATYLQT